MIRDQLSATNISILEDSRRNTNTFTMPTNINVPDQDQYIIDTKLTHLTIRKNVLKYAFAVIQGVLVKTEM